MRYLLFFALSFSLFACDSSKPTSANDEPSTQKTEQLAESPVCLDITKLRNIEDTNALAQTNILDFKLSEGCICITYEYSGCNAGEPLIVWDGTATKSMRPQVNMHVYVKEAGMCDQIQSATTCFNMVEMQSLGTQVLVYLNGSKKNFLVNYQDEQLKTD
ncbi:hypothetical protein [Owenweeksia hongkongensis]|uniref:hypothetical protein n=1 Tax=Owenweeksia hongkongensis TaxID=253245 RepID=UPI003A930DF7